MHRITNFLTGLGIAGMVFANAYADLADGLVADYPFNGNANDESGNGYHGTVIGAVPCTDRNANADSAYCFDGANDYINIGQQPNFPSWTSYAVSVWFLNDGGGSQAHGYGQKIIDKSTWYNDCSLSVYGEDLGWLHWRTYYGGYGDIYDKSVDYRDSQWHHVVLNKSGTDGEMWVDGQLIDTSDVMKTPNNTQPLLIGYTFHTDPYQQRYWSGKIDDVRIYDRPLSTAEIEQLYTGLIQVTIDVKPGSDPNCININGHGLIPVAILGGADFAVTDIDTGSLDFAGLEVRVKGNGNPQCSFELVNSNDTILDLLCHFVDDPANWNPGDGVATLTGSLQDSTPFEGTDSICIVPPAN